MTKQLKMICVSPSLPSHPNPLCWFFLDLFSKLRREIEVVIYFIAGTRKIWVFVVSSNSKLADITFMAKIPFRFQTSGIIRVFWTTKFVTIFRAYGGQYSIVFKFCKFRSSFIINFVFFFFPFLSKYFLNRWKFYAENNRNDMVIITILTFRN